MGGLYAKQGKYPEAEALDAKVLESRRRVLGAEHPYTMYSLTHLGEVRLQQQRYVEAEASFRDAVRTYEKIAPDGWERYNSQSLLGGSVAGQKRFLEAEPLLVSGYEALVQRRATIPAGNRSAVNDAGSRIVRLYEDWGKPEKATEWRAKLAKETAVGIRN